MTLTQIIALCRSKLDDSVPDDDGNYLWSNDDLVGDLNELLTELCEEIPALIEDATTASICQIAVAIGSSTLTASPLISRITRAKLTSQTTPLALVNNRWMDANQSDWEAESNSTPTHLITEGVGNGKVRLYPPSDAVDTLNLTVYRMPTADLSWTTDQSTAPEIPARFHRRLVNGILSKAYLKNDTDTLDVKKANSFLGRWEDDKEYIKRAMLLERRRAETNTLPKGLMA